MWTLWINNIVIFHIIFNSVVEVIFFFLEVLMLCRLRVCRNVRGVHQNCFTWHRGSGLEFRYRPYLSSSFRYSVTRFLKAKNRVFSTKFLIRRLSFFAKLPLHRTWGKQIDCSFFKFEKFFIISAEELIKKSIYTLESLIKKALSCTIFQFS